MQIWVCLRKAIVLSQKVLRNKILLYALTFAGRGSVVGRLGAIILLSIRQKRNAFITHSVSICPGIERTAILRRRLCSHCFLRVFPVIAFDTSRRVDQLLLARVIGVAIRANFQVDITDGGTGFERIPANTGDNGLFVFRVNSLFHYSLQSPKILTRKIYKNPSSGARGLGGSCGGGWRELKK